MDCDIDLHVLIKGFKSLSFNSDRSPWINNFQKYTKLKKEEWTTETKNGALDDLALALLRPSSTRAIAEHFPQILLPLVLLASADDYLKHHQLMSIALGKLIVHPGILKYAISYYQTKPAPWILITKEKKDVKRRKTLDSELFTDLELVEACLSFLHHACNHFRLCWDWSALIESSYQHKNFEVRWLACQCAAIVSCMNEADKFSLINNHLSEDEVKKCIFKYSYHDVMKSKEVGQVFLTGTEGGQIVTQSVTKFTDSAVSILGVTLPVFDSSKHKVEGIGLIPVTSTLLNLKNLALGVSTGKPICLTGPVGCGKTALIDHLAVIIGRTQVPHVLRVQLGEETDAKLLMGGYRCSDIPGEFIWQPGALTQAVMEGHWLVLEDVDSASSDVAAVLLSLLETGSLNVPGFRDSLSVSPGFQLFFTYRSNVSQSGEHRKQTTATELLNKLWVQIIVDALTEEELIQIVQTKFPVLKTVASRMVSVFLMFSSGSHETSEDVVEMVRTSGRLTSVRDLLKWCARAEIGFNVSSQESALKVLQDAIDIFCCNIVNIEKRVKIAGSVAARLGIIKTKAEHFLTSYKAKIDFAPSTCIAGRCNLPVKISTESAALHNMFSQTKFALTRPSCCLLERLAVSLFQREPVLLVGETGTGKTSTLQLLAKQAGHVLVVLNMNQQSDSADLLGGYKPVDMKYVMTPIREEFETLFREFFNVEQNMKFLEHISTCFNGSKWTTLLRLMRHSQGAARKRLVESGETKSERLQKWLALGETMYKLELQLKQGLASLAFSFIEGTLVKALKKGYWVLLDEINLATAETLQCLSSLLEGGEGSVTLLEKGELSAVERHPDFRLLAAMNPATDVGKKDLPPGIRNRFTELFVDEVTERTDLCLLVSCYLPDLQTEKVDSVVRFYLNARSEAARILADPTGHKPHYSLRTLCRALSIASKDLCRSVQRSLYEALCLSFLTQLDSPSHKLLQNMISEAVMGKGDIKSLLGQQIPEPSPPDSHVLFEGYWVTKGRLEPVLHDKYVLTACVRRNLRDVVRAVSLSNHPVLIQGDTSVGKTSLITYLAQASGNKCMRINNHEHTDLQEYVGSYCVEPATGNLVFKEGVLVEAMRNGDWIILDELNLAPTDVLEALNRVLDDNRELYIPETQETIRADPRFRLFATQNPPGLYGGRKMLSRAFRNRFVELHFDEIPPLELEIILQKRCDMPASYCKKLVAVMTDLQTRRRGSAAFAGKQGFVTLRDLFRWGERYRLATQSETTKFYDWDQHLADEGYLVLAGRVRKEEETQTIIEVIDKHLKRKVYPQQLFTLSENSSFVTKHILESLIGIPPPAAFKHIVWTFNLRRMAVLVGKACKFHEPVLLVGETGCGKTTIAQLLAAINSQKLMSLNCHQNSESADFLGGLRPVRDHSADESRLFEWVDGPLVKAMKQGDLFLADELSLADDSVLERLNSLLEPERKLLLSEKGTGEQEVVAHEKFLFIGTMNPGGDFGKKELSPALRNRLTEIWCEGVTDSDDMIEIIEHNLQPGLSLGNQEDGSSGIGRSVVNFLDWFKATEIGKRHMISIRDVLTWVHFISTSVDWEMKVGQRHEPSLKLPFAYVFGACVILIDGLGTGTIGIENAAALQNIQKQCLSFLVKQMEEMTGLTLSDLSDLAYLPKMVISNECFMMGPVSILRGPIPLKEDPKYLMYAETVKRNLWRIIRSLQLPHRAILLEGSPGVGKTSLITNLARLTGNCITRINLSEQTDVSDLFGADLPVEGAPGGVFEWRDGPFLRALKNGDWILLDELNLASQSILESLNAVLDHRGELFIPELGRTFTVQSDQTKLFACQNPQRQGGARKGLPKSFLNRFTKVFVEPFTEKDLKFIIRCIHRGLPAPLVEKMVRFSCDLEKECTNFRGGPWEMNLRDLTRWAEAIGSDVRNTGSYAKLIYADRMRSPQERQKVIELYNKELGTDYPLPVDERCLYLTRTAVLFGDIVLEKSKKEDDPKCCLTDIVVKSNDLLVLHSQIPVLQSLAACVKNNWMAILIGGKGSGKTSAVHVLSQLCGRKLQVLAVNSSMDTSDILGGFEQADWDRRLEAVAGSAEKHLKKAVQTYLVQPFNDSFRKACRLLSIWASYLNKGRKLAEETQTLSDANKTFVLRLAALLKVLDNLDRQEVVSLRKELASLQEAAKKEDGLITGGTFEWVDSVLVKCLQEGRWLLVDNANLCSPAVLDRLNGLLEPNGELVLGERGVSADGTLVTVKPHPQFRLFVTMDPRYGEISRAMRNRGVEIYMPNNKAEDIHKLDVYSLLDRAGLKLRKHQDVLIAVHDTVVQLTQGLEQPNINQLLHAASLIVQLWKYGLSLKQAFKTSCIDVYLKAQNMVSFQKNKISFAINEVMTLNESALLSFDPIIRDCFETKVSTFDAQNNSYMSMMMRQGVVLAGALSAFTLADDCKKNVSDLTMKDLIGDRYKDADLKEINKSYLKMKLMDLVPNLLINFYSSTSRSSALLQYDWITKVAENYEKTDKISNEITRIASQSSEALSEFLKVADISCDTTTALDRNDLPWDLRRVPTNGVKKEESYTWSSENKMIALLNFIVRLIMLNRETQSNEDSKKSLKLETMTVLEYSNALKEGLLSDMVTDEPLISQLNSFLAAIDDCVILALKSTEISLTTESLFQLLNALEWRYRFNNIGKMVLFQGPTSAQCLPQVHQNVRTLLALHFKWLAKSLLPLLVEMLETNSSLYSSRQANTLISLVSEVEMSLGKATTPLLSLAKNMRQICGQPLPLTSRKEADLNLLWNKLDDKLSLDQPCVRKSDFINKVLRNLSPEHRECRLLLFQIKTNLLSGQDVDQVTETIRYVQTLLESVQSGSPTQNIPEIKLWPIHNLISLRLNSALRLYLTDRSAAHINKGITDIEKVADDEKAESIPRQKLNESFCNWSKWLQSFPPGVLALVYEATGQSGMDKPIAYQQQVASLLLEQFARSPAVKRTGLWLAWGENKSDTENTDDYFEDNTELQNILSPLLAQYVASLALPDPENVTEMDSLRAHKNRSALLNALKSTLWRNVPALSAKQLAYRKNEESCVKKSYDNFMRALERSLENKGYITKSKVEDEMETDSDEFTVLKRITNGLETLVKQKEEKKVWHKKLASPEDPIESLPEMLTKVESVMSDVDSTDDPDERWLLLGQSWAYLGLAQLIIFSCIEVVDPVQKNAIKLRYTKDERETVEKTLCVETIQCVVEGRLKFPFQDHLFSQSKELASKEAELQKFVAVRPDPPVFDMLIKELHHLTQSLCSTTNLKNILTNLATKFKLWDRNQTEKVLKETKSWLQSIETFTSKFCSKYSTWYPDITVPVLVSITQIKYGIQLMACAVHKLDLKKSLSLEKPLDDLLSLLASFPLPGRAATLELIDFCTSKSTLRLLSKALETDDGSEVQSKRNENFRLAKFCLEEVQNVVQIKGRLDGEWEGVCRILDHVVFSWECQEQDRKDRLLAEESLYINKTRTLGETLSEEEEAELEISLLFNPNRENDFGDLEPASLESKEKKAPAPVEPEEKTFKLTLKDVQEIHRIHSELVNENTVTHWRKLDRKHEPVLNFTSPFLDRFIVFNVLLRKFGAACDVSLDDRVGSGLCLATDIASQIGHCTSTEKPVRGKYYDFYNDPHIAEVRLCAALLNMLTERISGLLAEWPDHPTLNQIVVVINRIMSFEVTSPVSRFLTGLELVLTKMREWEENAHSGVSLAIEMNAIIKRVIEWRKLELSCWKGCLLATRNRLKGEVSKWWFYLYSLTAAFLRNKSGTVEADSEFGIVNEHDLVVALQKFMEKSTLVEFSSRLELLFTFHCHSANITEVGHCELTSIFWNMYQYYKQFKDVIESRIKELGAGVEKKLIDFVKIARWNEITYWSVKETVERTHRTLHKYIKEYENILNEPAVTAMVKLDSTEKVVVAPPTFNPVSYMSTVPIKNLPVDEEIEIRITGHETSLYKKACKFCKFTVQKATYTELILNVEELTTEILNTVNELREMEVDRSVPREKQKSQAKNILQQKRKSLADLFRILADLGLSYRTGLVVCPTESETLEEQFVIPPLDIQVALEQISKRDADKDLLAVWSGCERHFWHAVARTTQLKTALHKPHREIGPPVIERCRGFTNHLLKLAVDQKKLLNDSMQNLYLLRCQITVLSEDIEDLPLNTEKAQTLVGYKDDLKYLLDDCLYCLEQFKVLLNACPVEKTTIIENEVPLTLTLLDASMLGPMVGAFKGDAAWTTVNSKIDSCIKTVKKVKNRLETFDDCAKFAKNLLRTGSKTENRNVEYMKVNLLTKDEFVFLKENVPKLSKLTTDLEDVKRSFELNVSPAEELNPFIGCFKQLSEKLMNVLGNITEIVDASEPVIKPVRSVSPEYRNKESVKAYAARIDKATNKVLITIQELYKKYSALMEEKAKSEAKDDGEEEKGGGAIEDDYLKTKIIENIAGDVAKLNLTLITNMIQSLIDDLTPMDGPDKEVCKSLLERCGPLFDQFVLLSQFVITHQLAALRVSSKLCSILLALFVELAQKGFCTPEDLAAELEEGPTELKGGMGLGEGEGEKDVSDQIESQDQLDDAKPKGEKQEEEDKDCKEEEKGIEMSDDFGGKLQDLDKKEDEDMDEDSEKEEEPDKEMAETEKGAETLDQQIWGSDSEDEIDENEKKEEEGERGEQVGEKEWGAEDGKEPEEHEEKQGQKEKDKEEKEINEMEDKEGDDDQVDPYHSKNQNQQEPEEFDLPEDLMLDDGEGKDKEDEEGVDEENPFDIDTMKDQNPPEEENEEGETEENKTKDDEVINLDSSEDEEDPGGRREEQEKMDVDDDDQGEDPENPDGDGGKKDEEKTGEENKPEPEGEKEEDSQAKPSEDLPTNEQVQSAEETSGSKDQVSKESQGADNVEKLPEDSGVSEGPEQEGVGQSQDQQDPNAGHGGTAKKASRDSQPKGQEEKRQRPGQSDQDRALGDAMEPLKKKMKTMNMDNQEKEVQDPQQEGIEEDEAADLYQHITDATRAESDVQVLDAATKEQFEKQNVPNEEDETAEELKEEDVICLDEDEPDMEVEEIPKERAEKIKDSGKDGEKSSNVEGKDLMEIDSQVEVKGDIIETQDVARGTESTFHTKWEEIETDSQTKLSVSELRNQVEQQLASWIQPPETEEASEAWSKLNGAVAGLAAELSEQLRLVLEPTAASRLKGDFRTGRRINMRKVIPYIASQFRKDKIWLRRTKPSKRDYQIVLAVDDSSSMSDNHSKELAFESLALVSKALTLLEVGDLGVLSFGEKPQVLHPLSEPFTEHSGAKLMQQFLFEQQKTNVGSLVDFVCDMLAEGRSDNAQLLVVVSDGRGMLNEGEDKVKAAVRRAQLQGVFMVFIIMDSPQNKDSILDIRMPKFVEGKLLGISSYMDSFPFPFYVILRDINGLPLVLSDALRQWFELVANLNN